MKKLLPYWRYTAFYFFAYVLFLILALRLMPTFLIKALRPHLSVWAFIQTYGFSFKNGFLPSALVYIWAVILPLGFFTRALILDFFSQPRGGGRYLALFACVSAFIISFSLYPSPAHLIITFIMAIFLRNSFYYDDSLPPKKVSLSPEQRKRADILNLLRGLLSFATLYGVGFTAIGFALMKRAALAPLGLILLWAGIFLAFALFLDFIHKPKSKGLYFAVYAFTSYGAYLWLSTPKDWHLFAGGGLLLALLAVNIARDINMKKARPKKKKGGGRGNP